MKTLLSNYTVGQQVLCLFVLIVLLSIILSSCAKKDLDIQQDFPFEVKLMPVPGEVDSGQTVDIRFTIAPTGKYNGTEYFIRYFQYEGHGILQYYDDTPYIPNDLYPLPKEQFRLYYTSRSTVSQTFSVWVSDNFGNEKELSFRFDSSD